MKTQTISLHTNETKSYNPQLRDIAHFYNEDTTDYHL